MSNISEIESLKTFIESSAFSLMPVNMQEEMKQKLQQLIDEESGKNKEELINKISSVVSPVLMDVGIQIALLVTYDKNNGVSVRELTPEVQEGMSASANSAATTEEEIKAQAKSIGFSVIFPDGTIIKDKYAKVTFLKALQKIGLSKIAESSYDRKYAGYPLVGKQERTDNGNDWQNYVDGWFVYTFMDNDKKMSTLMHLSEYFNLGLKVQLEDGSIYEYTQYRTQNAGQEFKVVFPDGVTFCEDQAVQTLAKSIKKIGLERVANLQGIRKHSGFPLVGKVRKTDNGRKWQEEVDGWFVYIYLDNQRKATVLHELDEKLGLGLKIYIGDKEVLFDKVGTSSPVVTPSYPLKNEETTRDTSKYSFNGGLPVSKRRLAWLIVKEYIKNYPDVDYAHLKEVFVPEITTKTLGVVRSIIDMPDSMPEAEYPRRYMMKDEDLIYLADGDIITVCSQWNVQRISKMIDIAIDEGWSVVKAGEENDDAKEILPETPSYDDIEVEHVIYDPKTQTITPIVSEPVANQTDDEEDVEFGVTFADGSYIEEDTPFNTFVATLRKIGLSRIPDVGVTYGNINLVSVMQKDANKQINIDGVYVYKDLTSAQMMDALQQISDYYYMDLEIGTEEE